MIIHLQIDQLQNESINWRSYKTSNLTAAYDTAETVILILRVAL